MTWLRSSPSCVKRAVRSRHSRAFRGRPVTGREGACECLHERRQSRTARSGRCSKGGLTFDRRGGPERLGRPVQGDDAGREVAPLDLAPPGLGDPLGQLALGRPRLDGLGEVDVGLGVAADLASHGRERPHEVLAVDGAEGAVGGLAELADDQPAAGLGDAQELAQRGIRVGDVAQPEAHGDDVEGARLAVQAQEIAGEDLELFFLLEPERLLLLNFLI